MTPRRTSPDATPKASHSVHMNDLLDDPERRQLFDQHVKKSSKFRWLPLPGIAGAFKKLPCKHWRSWRSWMQPMGGLLVLSCLVVLLPYLQQELWHEGRHLAEALDLSVSKESGWNLHEESYRESGGRGTCWALQERHLYYPKSQNVPSPALLEALREYELQHQRCTEGVLDWAQHFKQLQAGYEDCQYMVWQERGEGLGNRYRSILGAFQYALLTGRVLLLETTNYHTDELLCNPMPFSSWWLPKDFPLEELKAAPTHGMFLHDDDPKLGSKNAMAMNLEWYMSDDDKMFMCDEGQEKLTNVTWSTFNSNQYMGPNLWLIPMFQEKLHTLFPDRRMYTHMIRYIYVPVNLVWERVTRDYDAYFRRADVRVGAQIRTHAKYDPIVTERVMDCMTREGALPAPMTPELSKVMLAQAHARTSSQRNPKPRQQLLFVTAMDREYYEDFQRIYSEQPTEDGSIVTVYAKAAEGGEYHHVEANHRAMVDQLLLSMSDVLLISYASSFGKVVNGLAGHNNTFYMNISQNDFFSVESQFAKNNRSVCERVWGQESCNEFQQDLPCDGWQQKYGTANPRKWHSHIVPCQDFQRGLTLIPLYD